MNEFIAIENYCEASIDIECENRLDNPIMADLARSFEMENGSPVSVFLDDLSRQDLRELLERVLTISVFRKTDVDEGDLSGRTQMKLLAEHLARLDCPWPIRELILNVGRRLYYSTTPTHPYYRQGILDLIRRLATTREAREFEELVKSLDSLDASPLFAAADTLAANIQLIKLASQIVQRAIQGKVRFNKSQRKLLAGLVDQPTQRLLGA